MKLAYIYKVRYCQHEDRHHHRFNIRVSMLCRGWTVPPQIREFVERMFYGRILWLDDLPGPNLLEPMKV